MPVAHGPLERYNRKMSATSNQHTVPTPSETFASYVIAAAQLTLRIGVATGDVATVRIGGVYGRWEFLVTGTPLATVAAAERLAKPNEVVLTPAAWELVRDACVGTPILGAGSWEIGD